MDARSANKKKPVTRNKNHACIKESDIENNSKDMEGVYNILHGVGEYKGLVTITELIQEQLNGIIKKQQNIGNWIKATLFIFVMIFIAGVAIYIETQRFPDKYVSKDYYNQYLSELERKTFVLEQISVSNKEELIKFKLELDHINARLDYNNITRGARNINEVKK